MHPDLIAEISRGAIRRNLARVRAACGSQTGLCAVLKSNAYGHGLSAVVPTLCDDDVACAAVACLDEAVTVRELGWDRPILCLGQPLGIRQSGERGERLATIAEHDVTVSVADLPDVADLEEAAAAAGRSVNVQINVETGMGRLGILPEEASTLARAAASCPHLRLAGVYTHLAVAEVPGHPHTTSQLERFECFRKELGIGGECPPVCHAGNSAAAFAVPQARLDLVRVGLAMYGYQLSGEAVLENPLEPCLRLRSHIVLTKWLPAGHPVGYGCTFVARRATHVGIVPVGYADGYRRSLSNRAVLGLGGGDAPVIGTVSMDCLAVDLTDLPAVRVGDPVVVIDHRAPRPNSVESLAGLLETVPYEVTCLLGPRVARVAVAEFPPLS